MYIEMYIVNFFLSPFVTLSKEVKVGHFLFELNALQQLVIVITMLIQYKTRGKESENETSGAVLFVCLLVVIVIYR